MRCTTITAPLVATVLMSQHVWPAIVYTDLVPDQLVRGSVHLDEFMNWEMTADSYGVDMNNDSQHELWISHTWEPQAGGHPAAIYYADPAIHVQIAVDGGGDPAVVAADEEIGSALSFGRGSLLFAEFPSLGNWGGQSNGFLGIKFTLDSHEHYGWARLSVSSGDSGVTVHDFAYESTASTAIDAGAVPEPATVALLLAGAVFFRSMIRKPESLVSEVN